MGVAGAGVGRGGKIRVMASSALPGCKWKSCGRGGERGIKEGADAMVGELTTGLACWSTSFSTICCVTMNLWT